MVSNLHVGIMPGGLMKQFLVLLLLLLWLAIPMLAEPQEARRSVILEVIRTTYDISRTETLVYLRVFSDGSAEAHPTYKVDFRTLALKQAQISPSELARLKEVLNASETQSLDPKYERYWGNVDFGNQWEITIGQGAARKAITLVNFQPFLARSKKKPYPAEIEKLGCIIWELRRSVFSEPLERDYLSGCARLGY
jgi:hypothetical protein